MLSASKQFEKQRWCTRSDPIGSIYQESCEFRINNYHHGKGAWLDESEEHSNEYQAQVPSRRKTVLKFKLHNWLTNYTHMGQNNSQLMDPNRNTNEKKLGVHSFFGRLSVCLQHFTLFFLQIMYTIFTKLHSTILKILTFSFNCFYFLLKKSLLSLN